MYRDGHPNRLARTLNRGWAIAGAAGLWPSRLVTLEVRGRRAGRLLSFPRRYLQVAPAARALIPVNRKDPLSEFERIAAR